MFGAGDDPNVLALAYWGLVPKYFMAASVRDRTCNFS